MSAPTRPTAPAASSAASAPAATSAPAAAARQRCSWHPGPSAGPAPVCWQAATRVRIEHAFALLRHYGVTAIPAYGSDAADTRMRIAKALSERWPYGTGEYAFYTASDAERCFDDAGELRAVLSVHHHPATGQVVALALSEAGVAFSALGDDTVEVLPG